MVRQRQSSHPGPDQVPAGNPGCGLGAEVNVALRPLSPVPSHLSQSSGASRAHVASPSCVYNGSSFAEEHCPLGLDCAKSTSLFVRRR